MTTERMVNEIELAESICETLHDVFAELDIESEHAKKSVFADDNVISSLETAARNLDFAIARFRENICGKRTH